MVSCCAPSLSRFLPPNLFVHYRNTKLTQKIHTSYLCRRIRRHLPNPRSIKVEQNRNRKERRSQEPQQTRRPTNTKRMIPVIKISHQFRSVSQQSEKLERKETYIAVAKSGNPAPNPLLKNVFPAIAELAYIK